MTRTDARGGKVIHFESTGAALAIQADGLAFDGEGVDGCHGAVVLPDDKGKVYPPEYFRITFNRDEVAMLWIFDVEPIEDTGEPRTDFRMGGPYIGDDFAEWGHDVGADGVITTTGTGRFSFVQYDSSRDPLFVPLENGSQEFTLSITLTPTS